MDYGLLSILPPLIAIFLAFRTKDALVSLIVSIFVGSLIFAKGNIYSAVIAMWQTFIFKQVAAPWNAELFVLITIIGIFVALIESSGSVEALAHGMSRFIGSRLKVQVSAWFAGILLFFSDSANCLILGPVFRPLFDKFGVSREKLAYIVDSTASPVCMLVPISTWAILIGGIITASLKDYGIEMDILTSYAKCLPYQYYTILAVFLVPVVALSRKDFGPMAQAENLAKEGQSKYLTLGKMQNRARTSPYIALISLIVLLSSILVMLVSFGFPSEIQSENVRLSLVTGYTMGALACIIMLKIHKIMSSSEIVECIVNGAKSMSYVIILFVAALTLGNICSQLGTGKFLARVTVPHIHTMFVPMIIFCLGALTSFATGTANGTQAILIPLAIPLAMNSGAPLFITIGAAAAGGLFGDHCSPISDTTVLSSMCSGCELIEHVRTQLPYALLVAFVSSVAYFINNFTKNNILIICVSFIVMCSLYKISFRKFNKY